MRLIAILFVLQLSGALHLVSDAINPDVEHCQAECEDEGKTCPPLCSTCSCAHFGRPIVPPASTHFHRVLAYAERIAYALPPLSERDPPELFRPPRV